MNLLNELTHERAIKKYKLKRNSISNFKSDKNIYFVIRNNFLGSSIMRAFQIKNELSKYFKNILIIDKKNIDKDSKNALYIWVKYVDESIIKIMDENIHIYDLVDNYIFEKKYIDSFIQKNICDGIIVNNNYMKKYLNKNLNYNGKIYVIYHHWDKRFLSIKKKVQNNIKFGYIGSIRSLDSNENFKYYKYLINKFSIELLDTELCKNVTSIVKNSDKINRNNFNNKNLSNLIINFNMHLSIRENDSILSKFKTTAKIATASANNHNIITTKEESVKDLLPDDYPFLLKDSKIETIIDMFKLAINDYNNEKKLWNKGLEIMSKVKQKLSIENVVIDYANMINENIIEKKNVQYSMEPNFLIYEYSRF